MILSNHAIYLAGLFHDEQAKDTRQKDKYPFLLLFFIGHQRRAGNNVPIKAVIRPAPAAFIDDEFSTQTKRRNQVIEVP